MFDFVQGPPGPGGLLGELGKVGPLVSIDQAMDYNCFKFEARNIKSY